MPFFSILGWRYQCSIGPRNVSWSIGDVKSATSCSSSRSGVKKGMEISISSSHCEGIEEKEVLGIGFGSYVDSGLIMCKARSRTLTLWW